MAVEDVRRELRIAVYERDVPGLLRLLAGDAWPPDALQLVGDGLIDALSSGVPEAEEPARRCVAELRERRWDGDDVLAEALEAGLGAEPIHTLRPVPVDLEIVAEALEGGFGDSGGAIDLATGEFRPDFDSGYGDYDDDDDLEEREWLTIWPHGSHDGYRDMLVFIDDLDDPMIADLLSVAVQGRGAFRRFKDTLGRWPDRLASWFAFSDDRQRGRAREWLADEGYTPVRAPSVEP
ncbi:MAG: UPF0158 family protein [Micropruina sp.]|uniref:UPF0158 family protein n=1 Tax=Micropruina sp. TaxID=2737536 RepID=UPI0039E56F1B